MMAYTTEAEVIALIKARLAEKGNNGRVSVYGDKQPYNSETRAVTFKVAVSMEGSETIVNHMVDIATDTDRGIVYVGSQAEPTNEGEFRILFFEAKINPNEG